MAKLRPIDPETLAELETDREAKTKYVRMGDRNSGNESSDGNITRSNAVGVSRSVSRCKEITFTTGAAGTGKTFLQKQLIREDRKYGVLAATTGIAAVNMGEGMTTINSLLRYFDTESMQDCYQNGRLQQALQQVSIRARNLVIDEASMLEARQGDILWDAIEEVNQLKKVQDKGGLGLVLTGDFCQLPPVEGRFLFKGRLWDKVKVERLERVYRQTDPAFLEALNLARKGDGEKAAEMLASLEGVEWSNEIDYNFNGTTIFSKNVKVDRLNNTRLRNLIHQGKRRLTIHSSRWGMQRGEWKHIPEDLELCEGVKVMILSNDLPGFRYANGSCGVVRIEGSGKDRVVVELDSGRGEDGRVEIGFITREIFRKETPDGMSVPDGIEKRGKFESKEDYKEYLDQMTAKYYKQDQPYYDFQMKSWVMGEVTYIPLRLAYAATVHKSQGLTLDRIQIDVRDGFFGHPAMAYVAMSRVREGKGLRIVGNPRMLARRCNVAREVLEWV